MHLAAKKTNLGAWLVLASTVFYASHGVWSKWLNPYFDEFSTSITRSLIVMLILAPWLLWTKAFKGIPRTEWRWLAVMAVPGGMVTPMYFYSFQHLNVGVATLTFFTAYSLAAIVFGLLFFEERLTRVKIAALILGLAGLVMITRDDLGHGSWLPVVVTAIAGIFGSSEVTFSKKLSGEYSAFYLTFILYLSTLLISLPFFVASNGLSISLPGGFAPWGFSVGYAVAIIAALGFAITGYKYAYPGVGGIVGLAEAVFGVIFGILIFGESFTLAVGTGTSMILAAVALPILRKAD